MTIRSSVGAARHQDPGSGLDGALRLASRALGRSVPRAALVLTTGTVDLEAARQAVQTAFGAIPWAGGVVAGILTDDGVIESGAAVMCFAGEMLSPSVASSGQAQSLADATDRVGRIILAGATHRRHYPRGLAFAFASTPSAVEPGEFPARWRDLAGPRLRTVFSILPGPSHYGPGVEAPGYLTALCLEGAQQSGVGVAPGPERPVSDLSLLVHSAAEAAMCATKRLEGQPARAVLIAESLARHRVLGAASRNEWMAMREKLGLETPCLGWLADAEYAYGRGVAPGGSSETLLVAAMGDVSSNRQLATGEPAPQGE